MKLTILHAIVFLALGAISPAASACVGTPMTEVEIMIEKNSIVASALSQFEQTIEQVSSVLFAENFTITRGAKGNCEAILANGEIFVEFGSECSATYTVSSALDFRKIKEEYKCN